VTFELAYRVPVVSIPLLGRFGSGFTVTARHSEIDDPCRSGLQSTTTCPAELRP
jgi:hypothetical protein